VPLDVPSAELQALALEKMTKILGEDKGRDLFGSVLTELGMERIRTADDLYRFSTALSRHGTMEKAVGAILGFNALKKGARAAQKS